MSRLSKFLVALKEARRIADKRQAEADDKAERASIAQAFNDRYTFRKEWVEGLPKLPGTHLGLAPRSGYAWMCPDCNKIHHPLENSFMSGLQYPACCSMFEGHRLQMGIKDGR